MARRSGRHPDADWTPTLPEPADPEAEKPSHEQLLFRLLTEIGIINQLAETAFERVLPHGLTRAQFTVLNHSVRMGDNRTPAQLAAVHPESGGTYVYARGRLGPFWGHLAGWGFVVGKTASCAAMALTVGAYLWPAHDRAVAIAAVVASPGDPAGQRHGR